MSLDQWFEIARNVPLLREINAAAFEILKKEASSLSLGPEAVLFGAGDAPDSLYLVIEGRLRLEAPGENRESSQVLAELGPGDCTGELALLRGSPHSVNAVGTGPTRLLQIRKPILDRMLAQDAQLRKKVLDLAARRMVSEHIGSIPLLAGTAAGKSMDRECNWLRLEPGERLFRAGSRPDFLYVVVSGRLEAVRADAAGKEEIVDVLARGACIGDVELLTGEPRDCDVRAVRSSELVRISKAEFEAALVNPPRGAAHIAQNVAKRLGQKSPQRDRAGISVIACIPVRPGERYRRFVSLFAECLAHHGTTAALNRRVLDSQRGVELPDQTGSEAARRWLTDWIADYEARYRYVLADCDTPHALWREACLAQADLILVIADAEEDPAPGETERILYDGDAAPCTRRELVLLHPNRGKLPGGTGRWLAPRRVGAHHHVAADDRADAEHLARMLTGNAVGIVLGGAGARGCAQLGVLKAMRELGIPIDMAGGTGIGAVIAAQVGMRRELEDIIEACGGPLLKSLRHRGVRGDTTPDFAALLSGRAHVRALQSMFGDTAIEDLWTPFFSVACSITSSSEVVHDVGPLWPALRAAGSIPGILPPVRLAGELLVCGGVLNSLPADRMRHRCNGPIVAVDVGGLGQARRAAHSKPLAAVSGWSLLWRRMFRRPPQLPDLFETLSAASTMPGVGRAEEARDGADIYLRPPLDHIGACDRKRIREAIDIVYRHALETLAQRPEFSRTQSGMVP